MKCVLDRLMLAAGCGVNQLHHKVGGAVHPAPQRRHGDVSAAAGHHGCHGDGHRHLRLLGRVHGADPGEALKDEEGMEVAARLGRDMAWMVKVLAESRSLCRRARPSHDELHPVKRRVGDWRKEESGE